MAKFKRNHADAGAQSKGMIVKEGIFGAIVSGLYFLFNFFSGGGTGVPTTDAEPEPSSYVGEAHYLPGKVRGLQGYHYKHYALSYNEDAEQAD